MESIDIRHYTAGELLDWIEHNRAAEGLSREVIRPAMAWALAHHPHVQSTDPVVAALFDHGQLAASTCAFPELLEQPQVLSSDGKPQRVWWFPMLWCKPAYRGKGYGLVVIGSLAEIYGEQYAWTAWAVPESIEIFEFLGQKTYYYPRYFMSEKAVQTASLKGRMAAAKNAIRTYWQRRRMPTLPHYDFTLRYLSYIDERSYQFICAHRADKLIQSSRAVLNWQLHYPQSVSQPLTSRVVKDGDYFADITPLVQAHFVQVWQHEQLVGVYLLNQAGQGLTCEYIYYEEQAEDAVFASVVEHIQQLHATCFDTEEAALAEYVRRYVYFPKYYTEQISLSIAPTTKVPDNFGH